MKHTNQLISAKSPYLLQHAHNPVDWFAWGDEAFEKAKKEDKLVLVSIGYSACHWCHVMERECFEDEATAAVMNKYFVNIKVDREERPDVDHLHLTAVQLMSGHGGWPLNCFVLPDGRPIYGGTYFPKQKWTEILQNLARLYEQERERVLQYAHELTQGIRQVNEFSFVAQEEASGVSKADLQDAVEKWHKRFDKKDGGNQGAPKFPMPNNYLFLLRYAHLFHEEDTLKQVHLTLTKMAHGGIYDQLGGGFARYSTDPLWKVPHFEKMLYDNAQLLSLYSEAYRQNQDPLYKQVVYETVEFVQRELTSEHGSFFSALDADSEGQEGLFYVWTKEESEEILKKDFAVFADYYSVNEKGYWEDGHYILLRDMPDKDILEKHSLKQDELERIILTCKEKLMKVRAKRVRPGLDDKIIASWNGLMLRGLVDAYLTFDEISFLEAAKKNAAFMEKILLQPDGSLRRCAKGEASYGEAFLDDYAFVIDGLVALFTVSGEEHYLQQSIRLADHCFANFYSEERELFYFSSKRNNELVARNFEITDNVIPASNSQMALNLLNLFALSGTDQYRDAAQKMTARTAREVCASLPSYSNWALATLRQNAPFYEVCIVGKDVDEFRNALAKHYLPNVIFVHSKTASNIALLAGRYKAGETLVYVCSNQACQAPVRTIEEALEQIK